MLLFNYTAKDKNGQVLKGEVEAENEAAAAKVLTSRDLIPITVSTHQEQTFSFLNKISLKDKVMMIRQLATMINAGLPISQSLKTLEAQTSKKNIKRVLAQASSDIEGGSQLSFALSRFPETFTTLEITLIASGETSGDLDKALLRLADQLEKQQSLIRKVRGAFIYPSFVIGVVVIVAAIMVIYVMPQMEQLYSSFDAQLPFLTRMMIWISNILSKFAPFVFLALVGTIIYIRIAIKRPTGRKMWDKVKLNIYGLNILLKKVYMARFARTLAGLVSSGVPLLDSLSIVSKSVGNAIYEELVRNAAKKVKSGIALSEALKENPLFPIVVPQMIAVGERTGELDNMLENLANYYEEEVDTTVQSISRLIEPILIVVLALIIGVFLVAIMMPIYQIGRVL
ncbi:MAG: type II secretion system F family protein [Patescibacteria group bacterium]|nr:type II secretion system F family protein [Patescibacteria group bacterium]